MSVETLSRSLELSDSEIAEWNECFADLTPTERVEEAHAHFQDRLIASSSFGPTAPVMLQAVNEAAPDLPVVSVRHHHETLETLRLTKWYQRELDLDLRIYDAEPIPIPLYDSPAFEEFKHEVKVAPFQRALEELRPLAFLSGRMRWQSESRADIAFVEWKGDVLAINPVADVSEQEVESFFVETGWPRDEHYFDPTKGPDQKSECGLNTASYHVGRLACQKS